MNPVRTAANIDHFIDDVAHYFTLSETQPMLRMMCAGRTACLADRKLVRAIDRFELPQDAQDYILVSGRSLADGLAGNREDAVPLLRFLACVEEKGHAAARPLWAGLKPALEATALRLRHAPEPAPPPKGVADAAAGGDTALIEYLAQHPDATDDDALKAVNAALPGGVKRWSLDRLRKNDRWKKHKNDRLMEFYYAHPRATIEEAAEFMGEAPSTVSKMPAHKEKMARRERGLPPKLRERPMTEKRADNLDKMPITTPSQLPSDPVRDAMHAKNYTEDGGPLGSPEGLKSCLLNYYDREDHEGSRYRDIVLRLKKKDLTQLLNRLKSQEGWIFQDAEKASENLKTLAESWLDDWEDKRPR